MKGFGMGLDKRINGTTKLTGLIGNPVEHTVSPVLHNSLFSAMGINGIYIPLRVPDGSLGKAVSGLKATGFTGFNVTIPYKEAILDYLDEVSEEVQLLGTANTVRISEGRLYGYNTDGDGFIRAFYEQTQSNFTGKFVCMLGAGGTARALSAKIAAEGAEMILIINRTESRAQELAIKVNQALSNKGYDKKTAAAAAFGSPEATHALEECDIMINTTSAGMYPETGLSPLPDDFVFRNSQIIYDVIYNPPETRLLSLAHAKGCKTANGAGMLYYQGIRAFEIWMETKIPKQIADTLAVDFLKYLEG